MCLSVCDVLRVLCWCTWFGFGPTHAGKKDENKQSADHSHTVVDNLRSRLKDATQEFKDVLTLRTENLKVCVVGCVDG